MFVYFHSELAGSLSLNLSELLIHLLELSEPLI